jgi:hypothetical protein
VRPLATTNDVICVTIVLFWILVHEVIMSKFCIFSHNFQARLARLFDDVQTDEKIYYDDNDEHMGEYRNNYERRDQESDTVEELSLIR